MTEQHGNFADITPELLLKAYACGIFPMAESADDPGLYWVEPQMRGIIPLDNFHVPRRLARTMRAGLFEVRVDTDFHAVISGCAAQARGRESTWINARIRALYGALFEKGHCHTVEVYQNGLCVGGLYGVRLGAAFFGESMFHTVRDASKVALVSLVMRLQAGGFALLDTQFTTDHLRTFGAIDVPRRHYDILLADAINRKADFYHSR
jgi:leucyl/phenylalanyl-tRNA--protein transferase